MPAVGRAGVERQAHVLEPNPHLHRAQRGDQADAHVALDLIDLQDLEARPQDAKKVRRGKAGVEGDGQAPAAPVAAAPALEPHGAADDLAGAAPPRRVDVDLDATPVARRGPLVEHPRARELEAYVVARPPRRAAARSLVARLGRPPRGALGVGGHLGGAPLRARLAGLVRGFRGSLGDLHGGPGRLGPRGAGQQGARHDPLQLLPGHPPGYPGAETSTMACAIACRRPALPRSPGLRGRSSHLSAEACEVWSSQCAP